MNTRNNPPPCAPQRTGMAAVARHPRLARPGACLCAALLAALGACANRPESISASHVSFEKYMDSDCAGLAARMSDARATLARHAEMQNDKANGDAVGVFLLGIPFSKLSGDHEADVAKWKGEIEAIETAQIKKKCV